MQQINGEKLYYTWTCQNKYGSLLKKLILCTL